MLQTQIQLLLNMALNGTAGAQRVALARRSKPAEGLVMDVLPGQQQQHHCYSLHLAQVCHDRL